MSIDRCRKCGEFVDTDYVDDCYQDKEGNPRDHYLCAECEEKEGVAVKDRPVHNGEKE